MGKRGRGLGDQDYNDANLRMISSPTLSIVVKSLERLTECTTPYDVAILDEFRLTADLMVSDLIIPNLRVVSTELAKIMGATRLNILLAADGDVPSIAVTPP